MGEARAAGAPIPGSLTATGLPLSSFAIALPEFGGCGRASMKLARPQVVERPARARRAFNKHRLCRDWPATRPARAIVGLLDLGRTGAPRSQSLQLPRLRRRACERAAPPRRTQPPGCVSRSRGSSMSHEPGSARFHRPWPPNGVPVVFHLGSGEDQFLEAGRSSSSRTRTTLEAMGWASAPSQPGIPLPRPPESGAKPLRPSECRVARVPLHGGARRRCGRSAGLGARA